MSILFMSILAAEEFHDIAPPVDYSLIPPWLIFVGTFFALAIIGLIVWLIAQKRKRPQPPQLPRDRALEALELMRDQVDQLNPYQFTLTNVDVTGLLSKPSSAQVVQSIKTQVISQINQHHLQGRSVGIVIAYGGTGNPPDLGQANNIVTNVYAILRSLAQDSNGAAFKRATYYTTRNGNPFTLYGDSSIVLMDVYFFV